jgi:hypothetical protein
VTDFRIAILDDIKIRTPENYSYTIVCHLLIAIAFLMIVLNGSWANNLFLKKQFLLNKL